MKESIQVTTIAQIESVDLSVLLWLNNLIEKSAIIREVFLVCDGLFTIPPEDNNFLKNIKIITKQGEFLDEYGYNWSDDILVIQPLISITNDAVHIARMMAYDRSEIGAVSPVCYDGCAEYFPEKFWGISDYITAESGIITTHFLYLKAEAIIPLRSRLKFTDFAPAFIDKLLEDMIVFGYKCIVCDNLIIKAHQSSPLLKQADFYQNIELQIKIHNGRRNILYVIQADFRPDSSNNIGGTQLHVKDLVSAARLEYNVFVAVRNNEFLQVTAYLPNDTLTFEFNIGTSCKHPEYYNAKQFNAFESILKGFQIDLLHVHHTYSLASDVVVIAKKLGIPVILTLHDFYYMCPTIKMFDKNNQCCIGKDRDDICRDCLKYVMDINPEIAYLEHWREHSNKILSMCDVLLTPSQNAKRIIGDYFPDIYEKIRVIEHGYDGVYGTLEKSNATDESIDFKCNIEKINKSDGYCISVEGWAYIEGQDNSAARILLEAIDSKDCAIYIPTFRYERQDVARGDKRYLKSGFQGYIPRYDLLDGEIKVRPMVELDGKRYSTSDYQHIHYHSSTDSNLNVAFIGGLNRAKGSNEIFNIITQGPADVNWFIFGGIDEPKLVNLKRKNLVKTNFYQREELQAYLDLHRIDVICILSLWPETFCYTLSEAIAYQRPVIVTDIGALGERTKSMGCGWTVSLDNIAESVLDIIERIKNKGEEFTIMKKAVMQLQVRSLEEMNMDYSKLYNSMVKSVRSIWNYNSKLVYYSWQKPKQGCNTETSRQISPEEYESYIVQLEQEVKHIKTSRSYKIAQLLSKIWSKFDFLNRIRG